jgi:AGZA family xanthine/uracil permease-like MFS transporter
MNTTTGTGEPRFWVAGDWNGFFGLFTNVLLNVIVLTGLCLGVVQLPADTVFGRILPALGIALPLGNLFYAYLAWQLGKKEGRGDVTAMPYGPSVPHMFIVVFLIMLPVYLKTKDPVVAWHAGLAWCFIIGVIVLIGAFVGPAIRAMTPRAAMLGTLAGISVAFISMRPAFQMWEVPWIGLVCFAIVLIAWTANIRLPGGMPGGLVAVIVGSIIGWVVSLLGYSDYMQAANVGKSLDQFGLRFPIFSGDVWVGLSQVAPLLVTAIPLGIYNFTEAMNNVESASAAGDNYNLRKVLLADGVGAIVGSMLGSPFPPAVYIGHPGWKAVGGRIGYSLATGVAIALVCFLGLTALLLAIIPLVAILPILLYIGLVIGAQAFQASPSEASARGRARAHSEHRRVGEDADRRRARGRRNVGIDGRDGQARRHRRPLLRARIAGRRLGARGDGAGRDGGVHHRKPDAARRRVGVRGRDPRVRRPDPRRATGVGRLADGGAGLCALRRHLPRAFARAGGRSRARLTQRRNRCLIGVVNGIMAGDRCWYEVP